MAYPTCYYSSLRRLQLFNTCVYQKWPLTIRGDFVIVGSSSAPLNEVFMTWLSSTPVSGGLRPSHVPVVWSREQLSGVRWSPELV